MAKKRSVVGLAVAAACLLALAAGNAKADTQLPLLNEVAESSVSEYLYFTAAEDTATISFGGYSLYSNVDVQKISLFVDGTSSNLLGPLWNYSAGNPAGSQEIDTENGPAFVFSGTNSSDYDIYSQSVTVTPGDSYTLEFVYDNALAGNNLLVATATDTTSAPEPATLALMLVGLLGLAVAIRARPARL